MYISSPQVGRAMVDMKATSKKYPCNSKFILSLQALTGSDIVAETYGIEKEKSTESTRDHQCREPCFCRWHNSRVGWSLYICNNFPVCLLWEKYHETCKSITDCHTKMLKNRIRFRTTNCVPYYQHLKQPLKTVCELITWWPTGVKPR